MVSIPRGGALAGSTLAVFVAATGCGRIGYQASLFTVDGGPTGDGTVRPSDGGAADGGAADGGGTDAGLPLGFSMVEAGQFHTCGIYLGRAYCWGANGNGELGDGTDVFRDTPTAVVGLPVDDPVTWITAGAYHSCALARGNVYCWGAGNVGQLGDGASRSSATPVSVIGLPSGSVRRVSAGDAFTCAHTDDAVHCWGDDESGRLGNGDAGSSDTATPVVSTWPAGARIDHVSSGQDHGCAIAGDEGWCWGHNDHGGALGDGSGIESSPIPVRVMGLSLAHVSIAGWHGCGITTTERAVYCWGRGDNGILGDGRNTPSSGPVPVPALASGVTTLECGGGPAPSDATCAIRDGRVFCWGNNQNGRIGQDPVAPMGAFFDVPVEIAGITDAVAVSMGYWHGCALLADATLRCWGRNDFGQLGDGSTTESFAPVVVRTPDGGTR